MISYHKGDLLESGCEIIAHQVNLQGVMGGGLAKQIADKYPLCEIRYKEYIKNKLSYNILGKVFYYSFKGNKPIIANCFSQQENFDTNYEAVKKCFIGLKELMRYCEFKTIGVPFKYGCGIANGDWQKVEQIFKDIFESEEKVDFQICELVQV